MPKRQSSLEGLLTKAEINRIKERRTKEAAREAQIQEGEDAQKLSQQWEAFNKKLEEFKQLRGYETPIVIYGQMMDQWVELLSVVSASLPSIVGGLIRAIPFKFKKEGPDGTVMHIGVGDAIVEFLKLPVTTISGKLNEWKEHGFKDPEVSLPVLIHLSQMNDQNEYEAYALKDVSSKVPVTPEMKEQFDNTVCDWLKDQGYPISNTRTGKKRDGSEVEFIQFFKTNPDGSKVQLTKEKFDELRDDPSKGLNAYFKKNLHMTLERESENRPSPGK